MIANDVSAPNGSGQDQVASGRTERPRPIIQVVCCDGADATPVVSTVQTLGDSAELLPTVSPETWFDQLARGPEGEGGQPADLIAFVGLGERIAAQRWIARAAAALPDTQVVVALIDASIEHAAAVVNQGARGLLALPAGAERIAFQLREMVETAAQSQAKRRAAAKHRKSLATLTAAEVDVLDGMLDGLANKQVAHNLSIGLRTVELRRSKIMKKMGASSLAQLVSFVCAARPVSC